MPAVPAYNRCLPEIEKEAQLKTEISWANIATNDRPGHVQRTTDDVFAALRRQYPEDQGYRYSVDVTESPARIFMSVTCGLNWGLGVGITRTASGITLRVSRESKLTMILSLTGFALGFVPVIWISIAKMDFEPVPFLLGGLLMGTALALLILFCMTPFQGVKANEAKEWMEKLTKRVMQPTHGNVN
jgi:hypothetical protein